MASSIRALGDDPATLLRRAELGDSGTSMKEYLGGIAVNVGDVAERHLAYPVLRYFHSPRAQTAAAPAVLLLSDATFLMGHAPQPLRPGSGLRWSLERSIDEFTAVKRTPTLRVNEEMAATALRQQAYSVGVDTTTGSTFDSALPDYLRRRAALVAACEDDGWAGGLTYEAK